MILLLKGSFAKWEKQEQNNNNTNNNTNDNTGNNTNNNTNQKQDIISATRTYSCEDNSYTLDGNRCKKVIGLCKTETPQFIELTPTHKVACHNIK